MPPVVGLQRAASPLPGRSLRFPVCCFLFRVRVSTASVLLWLLSLVDPAGSDPGKYTLILTEIDRVCKRVAVFRPSVSASQPVSLERNTETGPIGARLPKTC